jgi:hypothetical protein
MASYAGDRMMGFAPASTLEELDTLSESDIVEGYTSAQCGDPEPGENRGKAFWVGWRNAMMDKGVIPIDAAARKLAAAWVERSRPGLIDACTKALGTPQ